MSYKVPGLKKSQGMSNDRILFSEGDYDFEIVQIDAKANANSPGDNVFVTLNVRKGPPLPDGTASKGKQYRELVFMMYPEHPSFEQWHHIATDWFKSLTLACGYAPKGDTLEFNDLVGLTFSATVKQELNEKTNKLGNKISKFVTPEDAPEPKKKPATKKRAAKKPKQEAAE
jgi:hypothetical protein